MSVCDKVYNKRMLKSKKYVHKRLNVVSRVIMSVSTHSTVVIRSRIVHVATDSSNNKIYMHAHNL